MKIISRLDINEWSHKHTCANCLSQLEVESADIKYSWQSGYGRESDYEIFSANCPVCKSNFTIPSNGIPKLVQIEAKKTNTSGFDR